MEISTEFIDVWNRSYIIEYPIYIYLLTEKLYSQYITLSEISRIKPVLSLKDFLGNTKNNEFWATFWRFIASNA